jgi:hypothetical protein
MLTFETFEFKTSRNLPFIEWWTGRVIFHSIYLEILDIKNCLYDEHDCEYDMNKFPS